MKVFFDITKLRSDILYYGTIAQLGERATEVHFNLRKVAGSIPARPIFCLSIFWYQNTFFLFF